jgi:demethylmenaquinone methyltransferase/2-methoxy-6-polyprenyl-1,4-benzoquinol methylase
MEFYTRSKTRHVEIYGDAYGEVRPLIVSLAELQPGERVLDLATGGGYQAAAFAARGYRTIGMDYVHDRARLAQEQHGTQNLCWGSGDISRLPFGHQSIDVVTITFALHDLPLDVQMAALRELARVARRRVVIAEPRAPQNRFWRFVYVNLGETVDESLHFKEFVLRDFDAQLAEAGLTVLHWQRAFHNLVAVYVCEPQAPAR